MTNDMRKLSAKKAAEKPCKKEAYESLTCQHEYGPNSKQCNQQIDSYNICMKDYV